MTTKDELLDLDEGPDDVNVEATWAQELERRARDIKEGRIQPIPWEEVEARITTCIQQRRRLD